MLGAAEPDPLRAVIPGDLRIARIVGVRPHTQPAAGVGPGQQLIQVLVDRRFDHRDRAQDDVAGRSVDRDQVAFLDFRAVDREDALFQVDLQTLGAGHAGLAHAARHHGGVAGLAAARGQYALGRDHAVHVVGIGLDPNQDHRLAFLSVLLGAVGVEDRLAAGRPR